MVRLQKSIIVCFVLLLGFGIWGVNASETKQVGKQVTGHTININKATVQELARLDRVGEKYAKRIIAFREKNGPFQKPEDIMKVKGIGEKIWEVNKNMIVVK